MTGACPIAAGDGHNFPGLVEQALRAWLRLHERHLPWRPDSVAIAEADQLNIDAYRANALQLDDMLSQVEKRGGPRFPWVVDRENCRAILGPMEVGYYKLDNGGFSLSHYTRKDGNPDTKRDWEFIEDAAYHIARELKKEPEVGPVTLVYSDGPMWIGRDGRVPMMCMEEFPNNEAALERACALLGTPNFVVPHIKLNGKSEVGEVLWNSAQLRRECQERKKKCHSVCSEDRPA